MTRTVVSVDLAHSSYPSNGLVVLTSGEQREIQVRLLRVPLEGRPDPARLAEFLARTADLHGSRLMFLDGPQGWRDPSVEPSELRLCERRFAAPAKTGLPGEVKPRNYTAFVAFSIAVFEQLEALGWKRFDSLAEIADDTLKVAVESFPLAAWRTLGIRSLPAKAKAKPADLEDRLGDLQSMVPLRLERMPSHDELQAIVAGLAGFPEIFDVRAEGVAPRRIDGSWREGFIVAPAQRERRAALIRAATARPAGTSPDGGDVQTPATRPASRCPFCNRAETGSGLIMSTDKVIAFFDAYPVSPGHALIVPRRHAARLEELTGAELSDLWNCVPEVQSAIEAARMPDGYNIGINDGAAAGQTVMHAHLHVIPRYAGDVRDPRGGIRWVVADRARYWGDPGE